MNGRTRGIVALRLARCDGVQVHVCNGSLSGPLRCVSGPNSGASQQCDSSECNNPGWESCVALQIQCRQNFHKFNLARLAACKTLGMNYCSCAYGSVIGVGSLKPRLHKAQEVVAATCAGTGRTRSANPGRPEATVLRRNRGELFGYCHFIVTEGEERARHLPLEGLGRRRGATRFVHGEWHCSQTQPSHSGSDDYETGVGKIALSLSAHK